jgi:hypothetical protein
MFLSAAHYAFHARAQSTAELWEKIIIGLGFAGGCFLPALFYLPLLWSRRITLMMPCLVAAGMLIIPHMPAFAWVLWKKDGGMNWGVFLESAVLTVGGIYIILLTAADLWHKRDTASLFIFLWMSGVLVFTLGLNWTINGRSFLPGIPVLGILVTRRLEERGAGREPGKFWRFFGPALLAGVVSIFLVKADYDLANINKTAAKALLAQYQNTRNTIWFQGHWGFQYYMEQGGAKAIEMGSSSFTAGDMVVIPARKKEDYIMANSSQLQLLEVKKYVANAFCATMDPSAGAGFYSADLGLLPFAVTGMKPQCFWIYQVEPAADNAPEKTTRQ